MSSAWVVSAKRNSPIAIYYPQPVAVFSMRVAALAYAKNKNTFAKALHFYVQRVEDFTK